nr:MAG TPA: hypothetical protein [Caudoviricetes sp.]
MEKFVKKKQLARLLIKTYTFFMAQSPLQLKH